MDVAFTHSSGHLMKNQEPYLQYFGLQVCVSLCSKLHGILQQQFQGTASSVASEAWMD